MLDEFIFDIPCFIKLWIKKNAELFFADNMEGYGIVIGNSEDFF